MVCCSANPVLHDGNDAAASVHRLLVTERRSNTIAPAAGRSHSRSNVKTFSKTALIRGFANLLSRARLIRIDARRTGKTSRLSLHGLNFRALNLAILYAVQSGFRYPVIACQLSLVCLACVADLLELTLSVKLPGVQGNAAPSSRANSVGRKLVGSGRHSKCFFAGVQCSRLMPVDLSLSCNEGARHTAKIGSRRRGCKTRCGE